MYVVVEDPVSGMLVELAGQSSSLPATGQITASFDNNPQLPFEDAEPEFFGGERAPSRRRRIVALIRPRRRLRRGRATKPSQLEPLRNPPGACPCTPSVRSDVDGADDEHPGGRV